MEEFIPLVDFKKLSTQEEMKKLRDACENCGCFRIINHPIPLTLMAEMKLVAEYLHELPAEIKMLNKSIIPQSGYTTSSVTSPLYEALGIYDLYSSPNAVQDFCSQLNVPTHHRQILETYGQAIHNMASSLAQKMASSLGIQDADFKDWPFIFRIIKYNFTKDNIDNIDIMGAELHSDTGFITLLQDDETVSGLELTYDSKSFKPIPPKSGAFLCIVGDVGHAWSNGKFTNVKHRVICKQIGPRFSIGAFMLASRDGKVEAPTKLVELDHARIYRPFKYEDVRNLRITTKIRTGEVLDQFRISA